MPSSSNKPKVAQRGNIHCKVRLFTYISDFEIFAQLAKNSLLNKFNQPFRVSVPVTPPNGPLNRNFFEHLPPIAPGGAVLFTPSVREYHSCRYRLGIQIKSVRTQPGLLVNWDFSTQQSRKQIHAEAREGGERQMNRPTRRHRNASTH